jgi:heme oxygenase
MSNLKELTWEHHKNAERQDFVKELMGGITVERYLDFLHNQHPQYNVLEQFARLHNLDDVRIAPNIHKDILELENQTTDYTPTIYPVVKKYLDHLMNIKDDPQKLMAHIYVRHMGDLSGGQMIAKRVPGNGYMYQFDEDVDVIKNKIREKLDDSMAEEARICFDFATQLFKEMSESNS